MLSLSAKYNKFNLYIPNDFIPNEINTKWKKKLNEINSTISEPIEFLKECIQNISFSGIEESHSEQNRSYTNSAKHTIKTIGGANVSQEGNKNPLTLIQPKLDMSIRHTWGFYSYWLLYEIWDYRYCSKNPNKDTWKIEMLDENDRILLNIFLKKPTFSSMDNLELSFTNIERANTSFSIKIVFNDIDIDFTK